MARTKALERWRDGVRFNDEKTGAMTAHVDPSNGKLVLRGEGGSLEFWETPQAWLKDIVGVDPEKDTDKLVEQLAEALGKATWIDLQVEKVAANAKPLSPKPAAAASPAAKPARSPLAEALVSAATPGPKSQSQSQPGVDDMATKKPSKTTAKAKTPAKAATKKAAAAPTGPLPECQDGCGKKVLNAKRRFLQGHDARFHGYIKKYQRGDMKLGEFPALVQSYIRREGIKVGGKSHQ